MTTEPRQEYCIVSYGSYGKRDSGFYDPSGMPRNGKTEITTMQPGDDDIVLKDATFVKYPRGLEHPQQNKCILFTLRVNRRLTIQIQGHYTLLGGCSNWRSKKFRSRSTVRYTFQKKNIQELFTERKGAHKYPAQVVDAFFRTAAILAAAKDERDLYALKSLHYEKLKGKRQEQRSLRLNDQFRLIVQIKEDREGTYVLIVDIKDYH